MNVKYQIFVSSTYEDLKDERDEIIKTCLNKGHIYTWTRHKTSLVFFVRDALFISCRLAANVN